MQHRTHSCSKNQLSLRKSQFKVQLGYQLRGCSSCRAGTWPSRTHRSPGLRGKFSTVNQQQILQIPLLLPSLFSICIASLFLNFRHLQRWIPISPSLPFALRFTLMITELHFCIAELIHGTQQIIIKNTHAKCIPVHHFYTKWHLGLCCFTMAF